LMHFDGRADDGFSEFVQVVRVQPSIVEAFETQRRGERREMRRGG
jgi:hypothetical protein